MPVNVSVIESALPAFLEAHRARIAGMLTGDPVLFARTGWKTGDVSAVSISFDLDHVSVLDRASDLGAAKATGFPPSYLIGVCARDLCGASVEIRQEPGGGLELFSVGSPLLTAQLDKDRGAFHLSENPLHIVEAHSEGMRFIVGRNETGQETWLPVGKEAREKVAARMRGGASASRNAGPYYSLDELKGALDVPVEEAASAGVKESQAPGATKPPLVPGVPSSVAPSPVTAPTERLSRAPAHWGVYVLAGLVVLGLVLSFRRKRP